MERNGVEQRRIRNAESHGTRNLVYDIIVCAVLRDFVAAGYKNRIMFV